MKIFKKKWLFIILVLVLSISLGGVFYYSFYYLPSLAKISMDYYFNYQGVKTPMDDKLDAPNGLLEGKNTLVRDMSFTLVDTGQSDCIIVNLPNGQNMLIDAGDKGYDDEVYSALVELDSLTLDYVIGTHMHMDHIGSMDEIINNRNVTVKSLFLPKDLTSTSEAPKPVMRAANSKNLTIVRGRRDTIIIDIPNLKVELLGPAEDNYRETNEYSIITRIQYFEEVYIFMGDAHTSNENEILRYYGFDYINADVVKVGHHGSSSSSSYNFVNATSPLYTLFPVGKDNDYGHPNSYVLDRWEEVENNTILRTDINGTITCNSRPGSGVVCGGVR